MENYEKDTVTISRKWFYELSGESMMYKRMLKDKKRKKYDLQFAFDAEILPAILNYLIKNGWFSNPDCPSDHVFMTDYEWDTLIGLAIDAFWNILEGELE